MFPQTIWSKRSGLDLAGFDWLIEKRKWWYLYRDQDRRLDAGDRVAVLGVGLGVVASADTSDVHLLMWNKITLRIPRKQVSWCKRNWRWEADGAGASPSPWEHRFRLPGEGRCRYYRRWGNRVKTLQGLYVYAADL